MCGAAPRSCRWPQDRALSVRQCCWSAFNLVLPQRQDGLRKGPADQRCPKPLRSGQAALRRVRSGQVYYSADTDLWP